MEAVEPTEEIHVEDMSSTGVIHGHGMWRTCPPHGLRAMRGRSLTSGPRRHQRDDATLSSLPICHLFGLAVGHLRPSAVFSNSKSPPNSNCVGPAVPWKLSCPLSYHSFVAAQALQRWGDDEDNYEEDEQNDEQDEQDEQDDEQGDELEDDKMEDREGGGRGSSQDGSSSGSWYFVKYGCACAPKQCVVGQTARGR